MAKLAPSAERRNEVAIYVHNLWEKFRLYHERSYTLKDALVRLRRSTYEDFWALKGVSFDVKKGEMLGIIGENGSGKSTLLKCIASILEPTKGTITVDGRVSALIELGAGFHPDLTGRENIYLNGAVLGITRREVKERFDDIVRFAELEHFIDSPVRSYSSGMYVRLGFAIAAHSEPDVLLIDEVLAVGDEAFQRKCLDKIQEFKRRRKTIVFVSHQLGRVASLCNRAILLSDGEVRSIGAADQVASVYHQDIRTKEEEESRAVSQRGFVDPSKRRGSREVEITKVEILDEQGNEKHIFQTGDNMMVRIRYQVHKGVQNPVFGIAIIRADGLICFSTSPKMEKCPPIENLDGVGSVEAEIPELNLLTNTYFLSVGIYESDGITPYDHHNQAYMFRVQTERTNEGAFFLKANWKLPSLI